MGKKANRKSPRPTTDPRWPKIGPLGGGSKRIFSNFVYEDKSSPLALTIFCTHEAIIILSDTQHIDASEIDITVADRALLLRFTSGEAGEYVDVDPTAAGKNEADVYKIPLMFEVDVAQIDAGYDNDLLHISLPRLDTPLADESNTLAQ